MATKTEHTLSGLTLVIDRDACIGTGSCLYCVPGLLELDERNLVAFQEGAPTEAPEEDLTEACTVCPVEALRLLDKDGEQIAP